MALDGEDSAGFSCYLKWIHWNSGKIPIIMQSRNGPCPLIATLNVLLLREKVKLPSMLEQITADQLLTYLGESIMDILPPSSPAGTTTTITTVKPEQQQEQTVPQAIVQIQEQLQSIQTQSPVSQEGAIMNMEQHIHDAMEILPKLKTGLDVNMRFTSITDFEYTPECIIFDLLRIPLYHGWIIDPSLTELQSAIGSQSYNQLMDYLITNKNSQQEDEVSTNMVIIESFLEQTASQLTHYGLEELRNKIKDNELGILFRNNHFLTLFKRDGQVYTLVTDHGYLTEDTVVWEILDSVEGAGLFFDSNFQESQVSSNARAIEQKTIADEKQVMDDLMMALSLMEEERAAVGQSSVMEWPQQQQQQQQPSIQDDLELAKKLQAEWYEQCTQPATIEPPSSSSTDNVQPKPSTTSTTTTLQEWQDVSKNRHTEKSPANELNHEFQSSTNEPFIVDQTTSEPSSQVVVVPPMPWVPHEVSEQTATRPTDSPYSSSAISTTANTSLTTATTTTTNNTTTVASPVGSSGASHLTETSTTTTTTNTTTRPFSTSRGLAGSSNDTKNPKDSNCTVI